jgi:hypothetical protein
MIATTRCVRPQSPRVKAFIALVSTLLHDARALRRFVATISSRWMLTATAADWRWFLANTNNLFVEPTLPWE